MGSRIKDMVDILAISRASIENRKKRMKEILNAENDRELIITAREKGFI
jgi:DNA-binding CsgD family transcriptional regulator